MYVHKIILIQNCLNCFSANQQHELSALPIARQPYATNDP